MERKATAGNSGRQRRPGAGALWRLTSVIGAIVGLALTTTPAVDARRPPPPANRTYFVIFLGVGGGYENGADCLRFKRKRVCRLDDGVCGSWALTGGAAEESGLAFEISFEQEGPPIVIAGSARVDDRLEGSSLGGAATLTVAEEVGNLALVGREASKRVCRALAAEFNDRAAPRE